MGMITIDDGDFTIETNTGEADAIRANLAPEPDASAADVEPGAAPPPTVPREPDASEPVDDPEMSPKGHKPRDSPQARISQETTRRHAAEERAQRAEQRLTQIEAELTRLRQPPAPAQTAPPQAAQTPPQGRVAYPAHLQSYDAYVAQQPGADWDAYQEARLDHRAAIQQQAYQQQIAQALQQRELAAQHAQMLQRHAANIAETKARSAAFGEALNAGDAAMAAAGLTLPPVLEFAIVSSAQSGDVLEWLGSHPDTLVQLAQQAQTLRPDDAAAAGLLRLTLERLSGAGGRHGAASTVRTNAKPPIKPLGASHSTPPSDEDSDDESFDAYFKRANARDRKAGRL
jgi:hypothetical protein